MDSTDWTDIFAPNGTLLNEGEMIHRTNLSQTLKAIATEGPDHFYSAKSPIAQAFVAKVQKEGGIMTLEDMENYQVRVERAVEGSYRGRKIYTTGPPTSG